MKSEAKMTEAVELELLPTGEVKRRVPLSDATLWRWIKAGEFPKPMKIVGKNFWRADEINQWIERQSAARSAA